MPMKVENELMDGKNIENWLQSTKGRTSIFRSVASSTKDPLQMGWYLAFGYLTVNLSALGFLVEWLADLLRTKSET
jgi:hypothetical protein